MHGHGVIIFSYRGAELAVTHWDPCTASLLGSAVPQGFLPGPFLQTVPETPSPDVLTVNKPDHLRRAAMAAAGLHRGSTAGEQVDG